MGGYSHLYRKHDKSFLMEDRENQNLIICQTKIVIMCSQSRLQCLFFIWLTPKCVDHEIIKKDIVH